VCRTPRLFFPRVLHPVLEGGEGDEDAVVPPQVPTGGAVGQSVFDDETDGQPLDPVGVRGPGCGQVGQVGGETTAAASAAVSGERDEEVDGVSGACVAEVVQGACVEGIAAGPAAAVGAGARAAVAGTVFETRLG